MRKNFKRSLIAISAATMLFGLGGCGTTANTSAEASASVDSFAPLTKTLTGNWHDTYDTLIHYAKIETDSTKRFSMMHKAEDLLMSTGALLPIYYYTDQYLLSSKVQGMVYSPMGYKLFTFASRTDGGDSVDACIASEPGSIDPALNTTVDGANYIAHCFTGLYRLGTDGNGGLTVEPGLASGYQKTSNADGSVTYDFTMKSGLKWSDGTKLDANDFVYGWNRSASGKTGGSYAYMFDCIQNSAEVEADATGTKSLGIKASDDGTHFFCTLPVETPYFLQLAAFPVFAPVQKATVEKCDTGKDPGTWATDPSTYVTSGPYKVTAWAHDSMITLEKNDNYYDAANVKIKTIRYHLSDNDESIYAQFETGALDLADSFPTGEIDAIKAKYTPLGEYFNMGNLGTYYYEFNVNEAGANAEGYATIANTEEKRASFRKGISLFVDRNYLVNSITKGGQDPANTFVSEGVYDADGKTDFRVSANGGKQYYSIAAADYAANVTEAIADIKAAGFTYDETAKKFTDVPVLNFDTNTSTGHTAIAAAIKAELELYGITFNVKQSADWKTTVANRTAGDYECSRAGWLCDYNDPMNELEMWLTKSGNNDCQFGREAHADYTGYTVDLTGIVA
jgi:oligopeptide transport system substrate-binding protein